VAKLLTAPAALVADATIADYWKAIAVSLAATVGLLALAVHRARAREL
jgi:hypothetical protein